MISIEEIVGAEWAAWYKLTPQRRWDESQKMWATYLLLGGSLDPEPDTQSPFFFPEDYEEGGPYRKGKGIKLITPRSEIVG